MGTSQGFETLSSCIGDATNYTQWILSAYQKHMGDAVLEVGLGQGNYVNFLPKLAHYTGMDIDAAVVAHAKEQHPEHSYVIADMDDPELPTKLSSRFNTILCFNVLQYAKNETQAIRNMLALLQPRGSLLLLVPAMQCLMGHMDVMAGHRYRYQPKDIKRHVNEAGGTMARMEYFNPIGALGWWVNNHRKHGSLEDESVKDHILFFDRYIVPLSRLANPLTKHFFGQSLLCVVQKH